VSDCLTARELRLLAVLQLTYLRYCRAARVAADQWCTFTSTNMGASPKARYAGQQRAGAGVAVNAGKDLHITCKCSF
jgi:hypothetical protein